MANIVVGSVIAVAMIGFFVKLFEEARRDDFDNEHVQFLYREDIFYGDDLPKAPIEFFTRDGKVVSMSDKGTMRTGT